jgi:chromosome partitioning protein
MLTICVAAHKGGVGKTTVAANLTAVLGSFGGALAVDLDPQAGLSGALGAEPEKPSVYEVLRRQVGLRAAVRSCGLEGVGFVAADLDLAGAQLELPERERWHSDLAGLLRPARERYRWGVLDTAPGLGVLTHLALGASDAVVAVCPPDFMAVRALPLLLETVEQARSFRPGLRLLGIVPTLVGTRTLHEREALAHLVAHYGELLLPAVPRRIAVADAHIAGRPLVVADPDHAASRAFAELAGEVIRRAAAPLTV